MLSAGEIKSMVLSLGADQCGIAPADRFEGAPEGFHPREVYPRCKSVIVFLKRMPPEVLEGGNAVVYTQTANLLYDALDRIALQTCMLLEERGIAAIPAVTDVPYLSWDPVRMHGMGILSLRHAAYNAGLGILGRNTLLISRELGNIVYIGAVLADAAPGPDPLVGDFACPDGCSLCLEACPVGALDGVTVNQLRCRKYSTLEHPRGWDLYTCSRCRQVCPMRFNAPRPDNS